MNDKASILNLNSNNEFDNLSPHWAAAIGNYVIGGIQMHNTWSMGLVVAIMTSNSLIVIGNMLIYYLIINRLKLLKVEMNLRTYKMHRMFTRILLLQVNKKKETGK